MRKTIAGLVLFVLAGCQALPPDPIRYYGANDPPRNLVTNTGD